MQSVKIPPFITNPVKTNHMNFLIHHPHYNYFLYYVNMERSRTSSGSSSLSARR